MKTRITATIPILCLGTHSREKANTVSLEAADVALLLFSEPLDPELLCQVVEILIGPPWDESEFH